MARAKKSTAKKAEQQSDQQPKGYVIKIVSDIGESYLPDIANPSGIAMYSDVAVAVAKAEEYITTQKKFGRDCHYEIISR